MGAEWTSWSSYTQCSATCGPGFQTKAREKNCKVNTIDDKVCLDKQYERRKCSSRPCDPVKGKKRFIYLYSRNKISQNMFNIKMRTLFCIK